MLSRESIFGVEDRPKYEVEISEWGGSVFVRTLPARDIRKMWKLCGNLDTDELAFVKIAILGTIDDQGNPLWTSADEEALGKKSPFAIDKIAKKLIEIHSYSDEKVEDARKKSEATPS